MSNVRERAASGTSDSSVVVQTTSTTPAAPPSRRKRRFGVPTLLQIAAMIGIGALFYSSAADWVATLRHVSEVSGYVEAVDQMPSAERLAALSAARSYNSHMPQGMLRDPYSSGADDVQRDETYRSYEKVLRVSDNGVIGEVTYPRLGMGLPLYHGTSESVISKGVGHLYGSSLPVGGPSTHSVLTAHSGLVHASLFTKLPQAKIGDTFQVRVLGETHHYRVDQIETLLPEQTEGLRIVDGEDYVTLITCTPIGINSHRLLVRGVRVDAPVDESGRQSIAGDGRTAGFPWWAAGFLGASAAVAYLLFAPPRGRPARAAAHEVAPPVARGGGVIANDQQIHLGAHRKPHHTCYCGACAHHWCSYSSCHSRTAARS